MTVYVAIHTSGSPSIGDVARFGQLALMLGADPTQALAASPDSNKALKFVLPDKIVDRLATLAPDAGPPEGHPDWKDPTGD